MAHRRCVGDEFETGRGNPAQERLEEAGKAFRRIARSYETFGELANVMAMTRFTSKQMAATPAGELHEFGILAAAILAAYNGLEVIYLGPNLPASELVFAAGRTGVDAVLLGLSTGNLELRIREELAWLARELPPHVELWLGGGPDLARQPGWPARFNIIEDFAYLEDYLKRLKNGNGQPINKE